MSNCLTKEDKKIFFENIHPIQDMYSDIITRESFKEAEEYKFEQMRSYIIKNKNKLLSIRDKILKEEEKNELY